MLARPPRVLVVLTPLPVGAILTYAREKRSTKEPEEHPVRYEAEEGLPKDKAAEKRRDHAVLEAALNDLADPKNPEYKNMKRGREIIMHDKANPYHIPIDLSGED